MTSSIDITKLTVFNSTANDEALSLLSKCANDEHAQPEYAALLRLLYQNNDGDLSKRVLELVAADDNVYLDKIARGEEIPECIKKACELDLSLLQQIADTTCDELAAYKAWGNDAPKYTNSDVDLVSTFDAMVQNIKTRGFGM